jgi:DNA-binding NtrC family response regulator
MPHVLIVDDDAKVRGLMRRFLEPAGYEIVEAESAERGFESVVMRPPDVVFCDVHMPGANGLWLADQIRRQSPTTAVVLATGDSEVPPLESLRPGVIAYLIKPLTGRAVLAALADGIRWSAEARLRAASRRSGKRLGPGTSDV